MPKGDHLIQFTVDGPGEIVAVGNGNANSLEPFQAQQRKTYNGRCLVIIKSKTEMSGDILLSASSKELRDTVLKITSQ